MIKNMSKIMRIMKNLSLKLRKTIMWKVQLLPFQAILKKRSLNKISHLQTKTPLWHIVKNTRT